MKRLGTRISEGVALGLSLEDRVSLLTRLLRLLARFLDGSPSSAWKLLTSLSLIS